MCFIYLQKQWIVIRGKDRHRANTPNTNHLDDHINEVESVEQYADMLSKGFKDMRQWLRRSPT